MKTRFHKNAKVADILITAIGGTLSVGIPVQLLVLAVDGHLGAS